MTPVGARGLNVGRGTGGWKGLGRSWETSSTSSPVTGTVPFLLSDHSEAARRTRAQQGFSHPFSAAHPLLTGPVPLLLGPLASPVLPSVVATQGRAPVPPPRTPGRPFSCLSALSSAEARWDAASALGTPGTGTSLCIRQAVLLLETSQYQKFNFVSKNGFAGVHRERMLCGWVAAPRGHQVPMREGAPAVQGPLCWYGGRHCHGQGCPRRPAGIISEGH